MRARVIAVIVAVGCAAGGCASATTQPSAQPSSSPTPTVTQTPPPTTTVAPPPTTTVTVTQPPAKPSTPAPVATPPVVQNPAAVVSAFYAAINAQDYATAWKLGGDNLGSSYSAFVAGFAGTAHDTLTITSVQGNTVGVHLEALQTDGSTKVYDGTYQVGNGQIVQGRLTQTN